MDQSRCEAESVGGRSSRAGLGSRPGRSNCSAIRESSSAAMLARSARPRAVPAASAAAVADEAASEATSRAAARDWRSPAVRRPAATPARDAARAANPAWRALSPAASAAFRASSPMCSGTRGGSLFGRLRASPTTRADQTFLAPGAAGESLNTASFPLGPRAAGSWSSPPEMAATRGRRIAPSQRSDRLGLRRRFSLVDESSAFHYRTACARVKCPSLKAVRELAGEIG